MKKIFKCAGFGLVAAFALLFALGFAACSNSSDSGGSNSSSSNGGSGGSGSSSSGATPLSITEEESKAMLDALAANGGYTFTYTYTRQQNNSSPSSATSIVGEKDNVFWRYTVDGDAVAVKNENGVYTRYHGEYKDGAVTWKWSETIDSIYASRDDVVLSYAYSTTIIFESKKISKSDAVAGRACTWYQDTDSNGTFTDAVDNTLGITLYHSITNSPVINVTYEVTSFSTSATAPDFSGVSSSDE